MKITIARIKAVKTILSRKFIGARKSVNRFFESLRYSFIRVKEQKMFYIITSERNMSDFALRCLDSVYKQNYPRNLIKHIFIDDASTDNTHKLIENWLKEHPNHNVEYIHTKKRIGGTANNLRGFQKAKPGSIVAELNGDDALPDENVIKFINKVYSNKNIWTTYNSLSYYDKSGKLVMGGTTPIPSKILRKNKIREISCYSSHLHTFRYELFSHIKKETMIDPTTEDYWESADDVALYVSLFELAGKHSRHIHRNTYIYNPPDYWSGYSSEREAQKDRDRRIRMMPGYKPLDKLFLNKDNLWKA